MSGGKQRPGVGIDFSKIQTSGPKTAAATARPHTGLGLMAVAVAGAKDLEQKAAQLETDLAQARAERGAALLAPTLIMPSRYANRHADSFTGPDFEALKAEIQDAGGNVQAIKVRPLTVPGPGGERYELVFGHRRHRACLDLGLPVRADIEELDERTLYVHMERENRSRKDLSAWEQGMMYRRALDAGLFPSARQLAAAIGVQPGTVSKALSIAMLPDQVVRAFPSPNAISFAWASELRGALERDEAAVLAAAEAVPTGLKGADVVARLVAAAGRPGTVSSGNGGVSAQDRGGVSTGNGPAVMVQPHDRQMWRAPDGQTLILNAGDAPPRGSAHVKGLHTNPRALTAAEAQERGFATETVSSGNGGSVTAGGVSTGNGPASSTLEEQNRRLRALLGRMLDGADWHIGAIELRGGLDGEDLREEIERELGRARAAD